MLKSCRQVTKFVLRSQRSLTIVVTASEPAPLNRSRVISANQCSGVGTSNACSLLKVTRTSHHSLRRTSMSFPKPVAAVCDGGLFPSFCYDDSFFVRRFVSLSNWRLSKVLDSNFVCNGCNNRKCVCHHKMATEEFLRNGKRQANSKLEY